MPFRLAWRQRFARGAQTAEYRGGTPVPSGADAGIALACKLSSEAN
jgi:hypothetical protein